MSKGIRSDLRQRLEEAHDEGICVVPASESDAHRLRRATLRGDVVSPAPQVYALPELWAQLTPCQRECYRVRTLSKLHPSWVFADVSAAALHGLSVSNGLLGRIRLANVRASHARNSKQYIRHILSNETPVRVDGVSVTSLERTVFDCTSRYSFGDALAIADSALRITGRTPEDFMGDFASMSANNANAWRAFDVMALADKCAESGGESLARAAMISHGYLLPQLQTQITNPLHPSQSFFVDFYWHLSTGDVAGEMDGREKYVNPAMTGGRSVVDVLADERVRESLVTSRNLKVMRFSYKDIQDSRTFCRLMDLFFIPKGFTVPRVALSSGSAAEEKAG